MVLQQLQYGSLFILGFTFWQLSNHQLLPYAESSLKPIAYMAEPFDASHRLYEYLSPSYCCDHSGPAFYLLVVLAIEIVYLLFRGPTEWVI